MALAVHGPLQEAARAYPKSDPFPAAALLPALGRVHVGPARWRCCWRSLLHVLVFRTPFGFRLRAVGLAPTRGALRRHLARAHRVDDARLLRGARRARRRLRGRGRDRPALRGPLAGDTATRRSRSRCSRACSRSAVIPSALFFGALEAGAAAMQREAGVPAVVTQIVQGVVILLRRPGLDPAPPRAAGCPRAPAPEAG